MLVASSSALVTTRILLSSVAHLRFLSIIIIHHRPKLAWPLPVSPRLQVRSSVRYSPIQVRNHMRRPSVHVLICVMHQVAPAIPVLMALLRPVPYSRRARAGCLISSVRNNLRQSLEHRVHSILCRLGSSRCWRDPPFYTMLRLSG